MRNYLYSLRINIVPDVCEERNFRELIEFCKAAKIDDVAFFIYAEEYNIGHYGIDEVKPYVETIARHRDELRAAGVTVSLNPWYTLSHADRFGDDYVCPYRAMTGADGYVSKAAVCPTDEKWLDDFISLYRYLIDEIKPEFIWMEDDFRLHNHEPMDFGCFCDRHLALYNEKLGGDYDRESFVSGMTSADGEPFRRAYAEVNRKIFNDVTERIGSSLSGAKIGLMTSMARTYFVEGRDQRTVFRNLGKNAPSANRIHLSSYRQRSPQEYTFDFNFSDRLEEFYTPRGTFILPEIENFPHGPMSKSADFVRYQILAACALCADGITLSVFDFCGNGVSREWGYERVLADIKPFLNEVKNLGLRDKEKLGVKVMVNAISPQRKREKLMSLYDAQTADAYFAGYLQQLGVATVFCDETGVKGEIVAVADNYLNCITDEEIVSLFENNSVIVDGKSAEILVSRGLGYLIAAESAKPQKERTGAYSYERRVSEDESGLRASSLFFCGTLYDIRYEGDFTPLTVECNPFGEVFCYGFVKTHGHLVIPFHQTEFSPSAYALLRARVIKEHLADSGKSFYATDTVGVSPYFFRDESRTFAFLVNCTSDTFPSVGFLTSDRLSVLSSESPVVESFSEKSPVVSVPRESVTLVYFK